jgi:hypothetical protein
MCKRGHSKWFDVSRVIREGVLKKHCSFILGYRQQECTTESSTIECGDLPLGHRLPKGYLSMSGLAI